jgi:hypothetical protein
MMRFALCVLTISAFAAEPYTFIEVAMQFDSSGTAKLEYRMLRAVNSKRHSVTQDLSAEAGGLRQIQHDGFNTLVDPVRRSAVTGGRPIPPAAESKTCMERYRFSEALTPAMRPAAERIGTIVVDRVTLTFPTGRSEWWIAPSLDCVLLRDESFREGRLVRRSEATEINLGEPDEKLFAIPPDYTYTKVSREMKR